MKPGILHIVDSFEQGGTERQAVQLVRLLNESGHYRLHLACLQKRGLLLAEAEALGFGEIAEYPLTSFYDRNFVLQLGRLVRFLKQNDIRILHSHDFYTNIFGMTAATIARVPGRIASKRETHGFRSPMQLRAERVAYSLANAVVVNAAAVGQGLILAGVRAEKIKTIHNGVSTDRASMKIDRDEALSILGLSMYAGRRFVTIIANLQHEVKDHPTFLRAAAKVHAAFPEVAFLVAGEGRLQESLSQLSVQLGLGDAVLFLGRCERVAALLSVSDVCVLSSKAEGFSNAILEYMAAACPVVVTDVGGAREAVVEGETGYIVPAGDHEAMAGRIIKLLGDPRRGQGMGQRGRELAEGKFSPKTQLDRTIALYDRVLAKAPQTSGSPVVSLRSEGA
jgi:glycosyltransferase involved in cell wall biosynthesis